MVLYVKWLGSALASRVRLTVLWLLSIVVPTPHRDSGPGTRLHDGGVFVSHLDRLWCDMRCILSVVLAVLVGAASAQPPVERVVVLHGIARSSENMESLSQHLRQQGYHVINQDYPSTSATLRHLAEFVYYLIKGDIMGEGTVHFVGFSMGGLLVRAIINKYRPPNLGRVVLLATPSGGSEAVDFWQGNWLFKKVYGPAGAAAWHRLGAAAASVGTAGRCALRAWGDSW